MPQIWNNIWVVTKEELVPKYWNTLETLQWEIWCNRNHSYGIKQAQKGGRGRQMLVVFNSLPNEVQEGIGKPDRIDNPLEKYYQTDASAIDYYGRYERAGTALKPHEQARYVTNASVLRAAMLLEAERISARHTTKGVRGSILKDVIHFNGILQEKYDTQHNLPHTLRHFNDTLNHFKKDSYYSLIKDPNGTGKQGRRKADDLSIAVLNGLFARIKHKPTAKEIYSLYDAFLSGYVEIYDTETGELYDAKDFKPLARRTVTDYLAQWENRIGTHKLRSGDRQKLQEKYKPHHQLEVSEYAGSLLSIDDRQPPFWYNENRDRLWLYVGYDHASGAVTTYVYGKRKEGIILDFYRQLVRDCAERGLSLPYELECESSLNSSFKNTFLNDGYMFEHVRIEANNARGKFAENKNRIFRYEIEKKMEGWQARPEARSESNQSRGGKPVIIPYERLIDQVLGGIEEYNNQPCQQDKNLSRWEYYTQKQNPNLKPINWRAFMPHLGYKAKTSCNVGYIRLQGKKRAIAEDGRILTGDSLINKLKQIEGREIEVYWLDDSDGNVLKALAYYQGRYVCEVMQMPTYKKATVEQTEKDRENRALQSAYTMTVEGFANKKAKELLPLNVVDNRPKTLNNKYQIRERKHYEPKEPAEVEILEDVTDEYEYVPRAHNSSIRSWNSVFKE